MKRRAYLTGLVLVLSVSGMGFSFAADESATLSTQSEAMDQASSTQSASRVTNKFASDFITFIGSQEEAAAVINGLRNGTPILLDGTTITPPAQSMGYGNTYISLSLAKAQLARYGITEPTAEQLDAALTGGTITVTKVAADGTVTSKTVTLDGILTQRAAGMGWGQIAKANGFKLGRVISSMKAANQRITPAATTAKANTGSAKDPTTGVGTKSPASSRHITNAMSGGGVVYGKRHDKDTHVASLGNAGAGSAAHGQGAGITSAAGGASSVANGKSASAPGQNKAGK